MTSLQTSGPLNERVEQYERITDKYSERETLLVDARRSARGYGGWQIHLSFGPFSLVALMTRLFAFSVMFPRVSGHLCRVNKFFGNLYFARNFCGWYLLSRARLGSESPGSARGDMLRFRLHEAGDRGWRGDSRYQVEDLQSGRGQEGVPRRLKPQDKCGMYGTAEAVSLAKRSFSRPRRCAERLDLWS